MSINYFKNTREIRESSQQTNSSDNDLVNMLALEYSQDEKNNEDKKNFPPSTIMSEKLEAMVVKLKKDIAVIDNCGANGDEDSSEHHVHIKIDLLNHYIEQMMNLKDFVVNENKMANMLDIENPQEIKSISNHEKNIALKSLRTSWKTQNPQELESIMSKLKRDVAVVINCMGNSESATTQTRVYARINLLNNYIVRVLYIKDLVKSGGTTFEESVTLMQRRTAEILFKIREEVFNVYLMLGAKEKYIIARKGGEMTSIFAILDIIGRELLCSFGKIHQTLSKRKQNKLNKEFTSLPAIKQQKYKTKN